jgi:hypothetical protein
VKFYATEMALMGNDDMEKEFFIRQKVELWAV